MGASNKCRICYTPEDPEWGMINVNGLCESCETIEFNKEQRGESNRLSKNTTMEASKIDFPEWIKSKAGQDCNSWPVPDHVILFNRLFWAFDAGRDCVWSQYLEYKSRVSELERENKELRELKESGKDEREIWIGWLKKRLEIPEAQFDYVRFALSELQEHNSDLKTEKERLEKEVETLRETMNKLMPSYGKGEPDPKCDC